MALLNSGHSIYHSILAMYWRRHDGGLVAVEGRYSSQLEQDWPSLWFNLQSSSSSRTETTFPSEVQIFTSRLSQPCLTQSPACHHKVAHMLKILEQPNRNGSLTLGMVICEDSSNPSNDGGCLQDWAHTFFLLSTRFQPFSSLRNDSKNTAARELSNYIADIFDVTLRNSPSNDEWLSAGGRDYFANRIFGFVNANQPIELALPAFPCKSSNLQKVGGVHPDAAENLALQELRAFLAKVAAVYTPGAVLWIVSDGHVFSDCIGVDDIAVSKYDATLKKTYECSAYNKAYASIRFVGLEELLFSDSDLTASFSESWLDNTEIIHPVETERSGAAEASRKLLLATCEIDRENFRSLVEGQDPHTLQFYRGLSRFMLDDLSHPSFLSMSTNKRKKLASKVAAEMIIRNQAYSNLVELLFPNHIRLSIHAHPNSGPKFGVRLFSKQKVRAITSLSDLSEPRPTYEFQLPTPWHNSIMKLDGDSTIYLGKAEVFRAAISNGYYEGAWTDGPEGGCFQLRPSGSTPCSTALATEKMEAIARERATSRVASTAKLSIVGKSLQVAGRGSLKQCVLPFGWGSLVLGMRKVITMLLSG